MYAVENVLKSWKSGNKEVRLHLRKFDYLLLLMEPMNEVLDRLTQEQEQAQSLAKAVLESSKDEKLTQLAKQVLEANKS